jgi:hypothetical protein
MNFTVTTFQMVLLAFVTLSVLGTADQADAASSVTFGRTNEHPDHVITKVHDLLPEYSAQTYQPVTCNRNDNSVPGIDCNNDILSMEMKLLCHYYSQYKR